MTLLQIVNSVLRRLREEEVSATSDTDYATMIVDLVNDAKSLVESAWDWTALRSTITVTTADGTKNYSLTGSGDNQLEIINVLNDTANTVMRQRPQTWVDRMQTLNDTPKSTPSYYTFRGKDGSGDLTVDLYPTPDGVYSIDFNVIQPQGEVTTDSTEITVPWRPVMMLALALATRERGETGGTSAAEQFALADAALSDAIAQDAGRHPEETVWYPE